MSILGIGLSLLGGGGVIGLALAFIPGAGAVVGKAVAGALAFLSKLPPWVFAVAAAVLFGLWCLHGKHEAEEKVPALEAQIASEHRAFLGERGAFLTEKTSLAGARHEIDENNETIARQAADLVQAQRDDAANQARNAHLAKTTDAQIAALRSRASDPNRKPCTLSDEGKRALEDQ